MRGEDDDGTGGEHRCELCCDIGVECRAVHRARDDPGCYQRVLRQSGDECLCPPFAEGRAAVKSFTNWRTSPKAGQVCFYGGLVKEDQPVRLVAHPWLTARDPLPACLA